MRRSGNIKRMMGGLLASLVLLLVGVVWAAPLPVPPAAPQPQANLFQLFLANTRDDLERLATEVFGGEDQRPPEWTRNEDLAAPTFAVDLWVNNELIANEVFGGDVRPQPWFGATSATPEILARNVRHDLEQTADQVFGGVRNRPEEWIGAPAVYRCSRTLQNVLRVLDVSYGVRATTPNSVVDYCGAVTDELNDTLFPPVLEGSALAANATELLSGVRGDLERLADESLGLNNRPVGWIGNRDATTPGFVAELFQDLERFADNELGTGNRPPGWSPPASAQPYLTYLNLRYDVEALTDISLGSGVRPGGWQGTTPVERCEPTVQKLAFLVEQTLTALPLPDDVSDPAVYCPQLEAIANDYSENPPPNVVEAVEEERLVARSRLAFAYLDVSALDYMGVMPVDTEFRAWYRNFNESNMMFVSGDDFALFIDRRWTTLPESVFRQLPSLEGRKPLTFCDANWCNGPGPTPTPTGDGPLVLLLNESTPEPTRDPGILQDEGKRLVSWNNIRVNYLLDREDLGLVQVTLEVCSDPTQVACEPVTSVFDNTTGTSRPIISQFNGLNVYELPYGYSTNFILEGTTLFSRDVWISDPTLR